MEEQTNPPIPPNSPASQAQSRKSANVSGSDADIKPKLDVTDAEAQAILAINNLQSVQQPKSKPPLKLLIVAALLVILAVLASFLIGAYKPGASPASSSGLGLPNQSNPTSGNGVSNQINQDVKSCSNPLNATLVC